VLAGGVAGVADGAGAVAVGGLVVLGVALAGGGELGVVAGVVAGVEGVGG
jgi:hypothetical protein